MSHLRRIVGVLALIPAMTALTVFGGGEQEKYKGEDFDKYGCVTLHELQRIPTDYKNVKVHFAVRFHRAENLWAPFYTPFLPEDFLAFSAWEPDKKLWVKEDHLKDFPFLYIRKDSPDLNLVVQSPPYQMMELYTQVRNDFNNIPWIEVIHIQPCREPLLHDELLHHMIRGFDSLGAGRNEEAIGHLCEALHHEPPLDAAIDIHIGLAKAYLAMRNWPEAAEHSHCALDLCPHHDDAREIWQHAMTEMHAMHPAPQPAVVQPAPPVQPGPQAGTPPTPPAKPAEPKAPEAAPGPGSVNVVHPPSSGVGMHPADEMKSLPSGPAPPKATAPQPPAPQPPAASRVEPPAASRVEPPVPQPPAEFARPAASRVEPPTPPSAVTEASVAVPTPPSNAPADAVPAPAAKPIPPPVPAVAPAPDSALDLKQALSRRDKDIADLEQALDQARQETAKEVAALRQESAKLDGALKAKDAEIDKQVKVSVDLEGRLRDALAKLELSAKDVAAADARVRDAQAELTAARTKLASSEEARKRAAAELDEARKAPTQGNDALAKMTQNVKDLETENAQLRDKVASLEALQAENSALKRQVETLTTRNGELEKSVADLKAQLASVPQATPGSDEAAKYAKQAEALMAEKADLSNRIQTIGSEREDLAGQIKDRDGRIRSMEIRIHELEEAVKQSMSLGLSGARAADPNAEPPKPHGRFWGFESRTPETVREEIRAYRAWLARQERKPGAVEKSMTVEPELLEPAIGKGAVSNR